MLNKTFFQSERPLTVTLYFDFLLRYLGNAKLPRESCWDIWK